MMRLLLIILLFFLSWMVGAQNYEATIISPGTVKIKGSSNINNFSLDYMKPVSGKRIISFAKIQNNKISLKGDTKIALEVNAFSSSYGMITRDFKKMLKSDAFPFINIELLQIIKNKDDLSKIYAMAVVTLANTRRLEIFPVKFVKKSDNTYALTSNHKISLKNYNLEPPKKVMGMLSVNDTVTIEIVMNVNYKKL